MHCTRHALRKREKSQMEEGPFNCNITNQLLKNTLQS